MTWTEQRLGHGQAVIINMYMMIIWFRRSVNSNDDDFWNKRHRFQAWFGVDRYIMPTACQNDHDLVYDVKSPPLTVDRLARDIELWFGITVLPCDSCECLPLREQWRERRNLRRSVKLSFFFFLLWGNMPDWSQKKKITGEKTWLSTTVKNHHLKNKQGSTVKKNHVAYF